MKVPDGVVVRASQVSDSTGGPNLSQRSRAPKRPLFQTEGAARPGLHLRDVGAVFRPEVHRSGSGRTGGYRGTACATATPALLIAEGLGTWCLSAASWG